MSTTQRALIMLLVGSTTFACSPRVCDPATATCGDSAPRVATVGQDFVLAPGQRASISSTGLMVTFERVTADSRCPRDVVCVWSGSAALRLEVVKNGVAEWSGILNTHEEPRQVTLGDHELRVIALTPDPVSTAPIQGQQYRLTLRVIAIQP